MAGAKGKSRRFEPVNVSGIDTRIWQEKGSSNDTEGVVFTLRGEVAKVKGISKLVQWSGGDADPGFSTNGAFGLYQLHHHGSTELLIAYEDEVAVLEGNTLNTVADGFRSQRRSRDAVRACRYADMLMFFDGQNQNVRFDGHLKAPLGVTAPPPPVRTAVLNTKSASTLFSELAITKGTVDVTYSYVQTYINDRGQEGEASFITSTNDSGVSTDDFFNIAVVSDCTPQQENVVARNFYRATDGITYTLIRRLNGIKGQLFMDYIGAGNEPSTVSLFAEGSNSPPPVCKSAFVFRGRTYYWGVSDTPSFLYYSKTNSPEAVPTQNVLDVSSFDGDVITGASVANDYALVFKRNSIFLLSHDRDDNPLLSPISRGVGAVSDLGIVQFDGRVYFLSDDGFFVTDGSQTKPLSRELDEMVRLLPPAYLQDSFGWADRSGRRVYLSVNAGASDYNNEVWAIHIDTGAITRLTGFVLGAAINYKQETVVIFQSESGGSKKWELGLWDADDNIRDTAYKGRWETRWLDMGDPGADKRFSHVMVYYVQDGSHSISIDWASSWDERTDAGTGSATLTYVDPDGNNDAVLWDSGSWDTSRKWDGARIRSVRVDITSDDQVSVLGKCIRFGFQTTGSNTPFHIAGFEVFYEDHGSRQDGTDATF